MRRREELAMPPGLSFFKALHRTTVTLNQKVHSARERQASSSIASKWPAEDGSGEISGQWLDSPLFRVCLCLRMYSTCTPYSLHTSPHRHSSEGGIERERKREEGKACDLPAIHHSEEQRLTLFPPSHSSTIVFCQSSKLDYSGMPLRQLRKLMMPYET